MNYKPDNNNNIEEILNSLNGVHRAQPQPYFYTRLMAKWNNQKNGWEKILDFGLNQEEQATFNKSADAVRSMNDVLKTL